MAVGHQKRPTRGTQTSKEGGATQSRSGESNARRASQADERGARFLQQQNSRYGVKRWTDIPSDNVRAMRAMTDHLGVTSRFDRALRAGELDSRARRELDDLVRREFSSGSTGEMVQGGPASPFDRDLFPDSYLGQMTDYA